VARLVGSLRLQVFFAKEPYKRNDILQKRPKVESGDSARAAGASAAPALRGTKNGTKNGANDQKKMGQIPSSAWNKKANDQKKGQEKGGVKLRQLSIERGDCGSSVQPGGCTWIETWKNKWGDKE